MTMRKAENNRKRLIPALLAAALALLLGVMALSLAACGGEEKSSPLDMEAAVQAVRDAGGYTDELVALDDTTLGKMYPALDPEKLDGFVSYVSGSMGTPEEVSVFKAKTEGDVADVRAAVDRRLEDQTMSFEDYRPDEMPKLENAVVLERGLYVILAVCPEYEAAREALGKL